MAIQLKSPSEIAKLREANLIVAEVLDALEAASKPGVATWELNEIADRKLFPVGHLVVFEGEVRSRPGDDACANRGKLPGSGNEVRVNVRFNRGDRAHAGLARGRCVHGRVPPRIDDQRLIGVVRLAKQPPADAIGSD